MKDTCGGLAAVAARRQQRVFGVAARTRRHGAEDLVADGEAIHIAAHLAHHARDLGSENGRQVGRVGRPVAAGADLPVDGVDPGRPDLHQQFSGQWCRHGEIQELLDLWSAVDAVSESLHDHPFSTGRTQPPRRYALATVRPPSKTCPLRPVTTRALAAHITASLGPRDAGFRRGSVYPFVVTPWSAVPRARQRRPGHRHTVASRLRRISGPARPAEAKE